MLVASSSARAQQTVVVDHKDRQSLNNPDYLSLLQNAFRVPQNSYQVRGGTGFDGTQDITSRPYFVFPLSGLDPNQQISEVSIRIFHPRRSMDSWRSYEIMGFFSIDRFSSDELMALRTPATITQAAKDELGDMFADLGDGTFYGSFASTSEYEDKFQVAKLNRELVDALNRAIAAGDEDFAMGGNLVSLDYTRSFPDRVAQVQRIFRASSDTPTSTGLVPKPPTSLLLTYGTTPTAPSPAPVLGGAFGVLSLGSGLGLLALRRRRRRI